jgi:hypothetical protein
MSLFLLRVRTEWNDYFPGSVPSQTFKTTKYTTVQSTTSTYVYVSSCLFSGCTSTSDGGALSCSSSVRYLLVESSSFFSCSTSNSNGGAIYFYNINNGECVLHKVCGNDCLSSSYGRFAYIYVPNSALNKVYVNYSSISRCVSSGASATLYICFGKFYCPSVNISMNKCNYCSGTRCIVTADSNYITCFISYSSFTDNNSQGSTCISQDRTAVRAEMIYCNMLRNTQGSPSSDAAFRFDGNTQIKDSCILMNNATYTFYAWSSYVITVSNCTLDSTNYRNNVVFTNSVSKSFIHALNHISTKNCDTEYDSIGFLTVIAPSKTIAFRCSCNCQAGIIDLFSLTQRTTDE